MTGRHDDERRLSSILLGGPVLGHRTRQRVGRHPFPTRLLKPLCTFIFACIVVYILPRLKSNVLKNPRQKGNSCVIRKVIAKICASKVMFLWNL